MSEPYVIISDCKTVADTMRAYLVECPHFPMGQQMYAHKALMHPGASIPPPAENDEVGDLVILKRFVIENDITKYTEYQEHSEDE